ENSFTGFVHRLDCLLEPGGGGERTQVTTRINSHCYATGHRFAVDSANVGGRLSRFADTRGVRFGGFSKRAYVNVVAAGGKIRSGVTTQGDVVGAALIVRERLKP